jgi:hypothetical protein
MAARLSATLRIKSSLVALGFCFLYFLQTLVGFRQEAAGFLLLIARKIHVGRATFQLSRYLITLIR